MVGIDGGNSEPSQDEARRKLLRMREELEQKVRQDEKAADAEAKAKVVDLDEHRQKKREKE